MYVCGITPYDSTHLGHAATYLTYDLLIRRLEELGHEVRMVRNITDVDDSILPKARELGVPYLELAAAEIARFHGDMAALEMRPPVAEPRATESIPRIIELVGAAARLRARVPQRRHRCTSTSRPSPTSASSRTTPTTTWCKLARARGGNPDDPHRRAPLDFVLWQPSLADEPAWRGAVRRRPARLAHRVLGDGRCTSTARPSTCTAAAPTSSSRTTSARSRRASRSPAQPFARHWMHSAMVSYEGEKMSKSLGNLVFVSDLLKTADPRAIRLALMRHHYRAGFEWYDTDLDEARRAAAPPARRGRARRPAPTRAPFAQRVRDAIDDDLDAPARARGARRPRRARSSRAATIRAAPVVLRELGTLLGVDLASGRRPDGVD